MSQKLRIRIVGSEPIQFGSKMPNFELKSQYNIWGMKCKRPLLRRIPNLIMNHFLKQVIIICGYC